MVVLKNIHPCLLIVAKLNLSLYDDLLPRYLKLLLCSASGILITLRMRFMTFGSESSPQLITACNLTFSIQSQLDHYVSAMCVILFILEHHCKPYPIITWLKLGHDTAKNNSKMVIAACGLIFSYIGHLANVPRIYDT